MNANNFPHNCKLYLERRCMDPAKVADLVTMGLCTCHEDHMRLAMKDTNGVVCGRQKRFFTPQLVGDKEIKSHTAHGGTVGWFYTKIDFSKPVIVVEGEIDYLSISHLPNVIGLQGVAGLSKLLLWLESQNICDVYLLLDNDDAAQSAINTLFHYNDSYLGHIYDVRSIIGKYKDVNEYICSGNTVLLDHVFAFDVSLLGFKQTYQSFLLGSEGKYKISHDVFATFLMKKYNILSTDGNFFFYNYLDNDGIWTHVNKHDMGSLIFKELTNYFAGVVSTIKKTDRDNVYDILLSIANDPLFSSRINIRTADPELNLSDGIYSMSSKTLRPYTKQEYKIHKLPYVSSLIAQENKPLLFLEFLYDILAGYNDKDAIVGFLQEFIGHLFLPYTRFEKALLVYGSGANGKGVLLSIIRHLVGEDSCSSVGMHEMNNEQNVFNLFSKLVNIDTDMQQNVQLDSGIIKKIVSGEPLTGKKVYCPPISFVPFVRLVMATNELPYVKTIDDSIKRRFVFLRLKQSFKGREDITIKDRILAEKDALFTRAIQGCIRLLARGAFVIPEELLWELDDFIKDNDSVQQFLDDAILVSENSKIHNQKIYDLYKVYCFDVGLKPLSQRKFNARLRIKGFLDFKDQYGRGFIGLTQKPDPF